jgi:DNA-binding MarR family transcriptional regulator
MMAEPGQLSVNNRVLLHLSTFATDVPPEEYPPETAQVGIAAGVGISRTHVPRALKGLIADRLVEELTARVRGHERRMSVYVITPEGLRRVDELIKGLRQRTFCVRQAGETRTMALSELEEALGRKKTARALSRSKADIVEIEERPRKPVRDLAAAPEVAEFYGREDEMRAIDEFMDSESGVLVVLGSHGFGATTLVRRFLDTEEGYDALWLDLTSRTTTQELEEAVSGFCSRLDPQASSWSTTPSLRNAVVILDGYYHVAEEVVEFLANVAESPGYGKFIVTAREDTPAYNWFYRKRQVDSGAVTELRIRGLDESAAMRLLGNEQIDRDAFRKVFGMTRGQPMILRMLREGDLQGLKANTVFTPEEIRYLLAMKDKKV